MFKSLWFAFSWKTLKKWLVPSHSVFCVFSKFLTQNIHFQVFTSYSLYSFKYLPLYIFIFEHMTLYCWTIFHCRWYHNLLYNSFNLCSFIMQMFTYKTMFFLKIAESSDITAPILLQQVTIMRLACFYSFFIHHMLSLKYTCYFIS